LGQKKGLDRISLALTPFREADIPDAVDPSNPVR